MKKKLLLIGLIIASFILLTVSVLFYVEQTRQIRQINPLDLEMMSKDQILEYIYQKQSTEHTPLYYFIPIFAFFGIAVGALIYYLMSGDIEKKENIIKHDYQVILKLLNAEERKVIQKIVDSDGKLQQLEITYMEGFTKVKAHRILESLAQKGILEKEKMGKMRLVRMNKELYRILKN